MFANLNGNSRTKNERFRKLLKFVKILIFFSGHFTGEATVTYCEPAAAKFAISWFDGKDFNGRKIKVQKAIVVPRKHNDSSTVPGTYTLSF